MSTAKPGARIQVAAGEYAGGHAFQNLRGEPGQPIVIEAADPQNPPVFKGAGGGLHLSDPCYVELRNLTFTGARTNGINIDDGGSYDTPAHHIVLSGLRITDIGSNGNQDGIKLSGVDDFRVEGCVIERWGTGGGSAIDMVGCHRGVIERCTIRHTGVFNNSGVQAKGGSSDIVVRRNTFENAGDRAVNIGGSTGRKFFRPPLKEDGDKRVAPTGSYSEAKDIMVEGNVFIGGGAPVAFVGCDGAVVRFNTIYRPTRWALRILQETREPDFVPSRNGEFSDNLIVFRSDQWRGPVNVGEGTAPETFRFARNFWYCENDPSRSRPVLPTNETNGQYGQNPQLRDPAKGDFGVAPQSPAARCGAHAYSSR
ncbi:MAG: right-handed parallel beta-helix repeat-containing protein [Candidatus Sumerlaeia bacterium]|nr:right-handed parallel beta-helix repeat-containing protein [Candidatus Sumerlaeia bacterium]